jgi:hypothetical protein
MSLIPNNVLPNAQYVL